MAGPEGSRYWRTIARNAFGVFAILSAIIWGLLFFGLNGAINNARTPAGFADMQMTATVLSAAWISFLFCLWAYVDLGRKL